MTRPAVLRPSTARSLAQWLLLALLALAAGCPRAPRGAAAVPPGADPLPRADPATASAAFAFTGDFRSFIRPCGCTPDQPGGLVRLATLLRAARQTPRTAEPAALGALEAELAAQGAADAAGLRRQLDGALGQGGVLDADGGLVERVWPIECGNFCWVGGRYSDVRARGYIEQLHHAGYRAAVLGAGELQLRADEARALAHSAVPLVSCNLTLEQPLFVLQRYVELAPGWYVSGVSTWRPLGETAPSGSWWRLSDPVAAVRAVLAELPAGAKLVLVAAYQPESVYAELRELPLAALIGPGSYRPADERDPSGQTETPAMPAAGHDGLPLPATMPAPPAKGVFLPLLLLREKPDGLHAATRFLAVDQDWPDDAEALQLLDGMSVLLRERLREERAALARASGVEDGQFGMSPGLLPEGQQAPTREMLEARLAAEAHYTGSASCTACHAAADAAWRASGHAHALATLTAEHEDNNLDCLQCHTVGLYAPSGFDPDRPLPQLSAVGCESCHGPGSRHNAAALLARDHAAQWPRAAGAADYAIERGDLALCLRCHDSYNSPKFAAAEYWAKIRH